MGDVVEFQNGGGFKSSEFTSSGAPVIRVSDFTADSVDVTNCRFLSAGSLSTYDRFLLRKGDVVVSTVGSWPTSPTSPVGKVVLIPEEADGYLLNQNAVRLRAIEEWTTQRFVHYLAKTDGFKHYIAVHARGSANHARIAIGVLKDFELVLPPLPIQRRIAEILGRLDDKIEVNRRINRTLEQMAQALYKHWFVDFGPFQDGEFVESEVGLIPAGWAVGRLGDIARVTSGKRPKKRSNIKTGEFHVPLYGANGRVGYVKESLFAKSVIITGRVGTLGTLFRVGHEVWPSDNTLVIIPVKPIYYNFLFYALQRVDYRALNRGSTQPLLTQSDIKNLLILLPKQDMLERFYKLTIPFLEFIDQSTRESEQLGATRDYLLPKLLSGEVKIIGQGD